MYSAEQLSQNRVTTGRAKSSYRTTDLLRCRVAGGDCTRLFYAATAGPVSTLMHGLPITAAVREVLALLQLRLHQGTANTGVAVSIYPVGEPRARDTDLGGVAALDHVVVSVAPFLH